MEVKIPEELKELRALQMFPGFVQQGGWNQEESECPHCGGSQWEDKDNLIPCELCKGFKTVPTRLSKWYKKNVDTA